MRTRSLFTALACTAVLAGASAESAFADSAASPSQTPSAGPTTDARAAAPSPVASTAPAHAVDGRSPNAAPPAVPSVPAHQITAVPSGAPNTGVVPVSSGGQGEAEVAAAALLVLLGSGSLVARRKFSGRG